MGERMAWSRVCTALLALAASCEAFSPSFTAAPPRHAGRGASCAVGRRVGLLSLSSQVGLSKMEDKAVERMTKDFDKLCKTCPTRLQPRADTASAMLLALPDEERKAALQRVEAFPHPSPARPTSPSQHRPVLHGAPLTDA